MPRSSRRGMVPRRFLVAFAAALVPLIAGCEAGNGAPSLSWHQPTDGTHKVVGDLTISNVFVLGAPLGSALQPGQDAGLFLGLTNTGPATDRLLSISAPGVARSVQLPAGGQVVVRSNHSVLLFGPAPAVILQDLSRPVTGGSVVTILLLFKTAGLVQLKVPVMPRVQSYATLLPAPSPTPTLTPSASPGHRRHHHRASASPSPSPSST